VHLATGLLLADAAGSSASTFPTTVCDAGAMLRTTIYRRNTTTSVESLKVVASIDQDGDSEIRVTHTVDESVVDDRIGFHGHGGEQWLRDRHTSWTADGFELVRSGPEF
jgi:hypothetical protein